MKGHPHAKGRGTNKKRPGAEQKTPRLPLCLIYLAKVTILQQKSCSPPRMFAGQKNPRLRKTRSATDCRMDYLAILAIRCASRETLRRAALRWTMPRLAARISAGSASVIAATAAARSPAEIASSTLRTVLRTRARRPLLTSVRRAIWRVAFLADFVLGIRCQTRTMVYKSGAYRGAGRLRQRRRPPQFRIYRPKSGFLRCFQRCSPASS